MCAFLCLCKCWYVCDCKSPQSINSTPVFCWTYSPASSRMRFKLWGKGVCFCVYLFWERRLNEGPSIPLAFGLVAFRKQPPHPFILKHTHSAVTVHPKTCCVPQELKGKRLLPLCNSSTAQTTLQCLCVYACTCVCVCVCFFACLVVPSFNDCLAKIAWIDKILVLPVVNILLLLQSSFRYACAFLWFHLCFC